jgi:hypothetical protein
MNKLQSSDLEFEELFAQISPEVAATFSSEQIDTIKWSFNYRRWTRHPIDWRISLPILGWRFYIIFLAGEERRSLQRLMSERSKYLLWTPGNILFMTGFLGSLIVFMINVCALIFPLFSNSSTLIYPTSIPWLESKIECENTGRYWYRDKCWDQEHSPNF